MKKILLTLLASLLLITPAYATTLFPTGGGTGSTTLSGILLGNGVSPINTLTIGTGLTLTGTTLAATGGGSSASSTLLSDTNTWTGTEDFTTNTGFNIAAPGQAVDILGKIRETSSLTDATNKAFFFLDRNFTNAQNDFLLAFGQSKSTGNTLIFGGGQTGFTAASSIAFFTGAGNNTDTGTSRIAIDATGNVSIANLTGGAVYTGPSGILLNTPTTTVTCAGTASCTAFSIFGSSPVTITGSSGTSASSTLLGDTNTFSGTDIFSNTIKVASLNGLIGGNSGTLYAVSTSSLNASITGNAGTATALATGRTISITGDLAYTSPTFDGSGNVTAAGTLATVNGNVGSFTNANITVNAKGLITAASNGTAPTTYTGTYPIQVTGSVISTAFGTTTNWGIGTNGFLITGPTGIPFVAASSTLNLPNTALQNSSVTVNGTAIALGASGTVTANTTNAVTFNSSGSGGSSPQVFNGSSAETISYNTIGAQVAGTYVTAVTATAPIFSSGGTTPNLTWAGLATTSQPSSSNVLTSNGAAGVYGSATTSATCTGNATCTAFTVLGSTPITINVAAGTAASSTLLGDTNTFSGTDIFSNAIKISTFSGLVAANSGFTYAAATSSIGAGTGLSFSGTSGAQVGGSNGTFSVNTTQNITTLSNLSSAGTLNNTSGGVLYSTATSTPTVSAPITYSGTLGQFIGGASGAFGCTTASPGVTGCLSGTDYNTFNGKENVLTFTWPLIRSTNTITFGGLSTTTNLTQGQLPYVTGVNTFGQVATGTISNGTGISVTAGQSVIGSGLTITNTGVTSLGNGTGTTCTGTAPGTCNVNTTQNITTLSNLTSAGTINTTASGVLYSTATSTITNGSGIAYTGTMGSEIGGVSGTLSVSGLSGTNFSNVTANTVFANGTGASAAPTFVATSTFFGTPTPGTILAFLNGQNTFVATTTFSSGLAYSAGNVTNTGVTSIVAGTNVTISGATGAVTINSTGGGGGTFPFTPINGTSVSTSSGLVITASSTIGGATQATGLTVAGGSTTTLNAYFNARVGIGDQSPDFTLESVGSNGNGYFGLSSSATGVEGDVFNVMSNGKVGIGSSTPYATLSINDIAGVDPFVIGSTTGGGPDPFFRVDQFGTTTVKTLQFADTGGNTLRWTMQETPSNDLSIFYPSIRRAVLINSGAGGGILAIGTTSEFGYTSFDVASNTPSMNLTDTDAGTNAKHFTFANNAGLFTIGSTSDAGIAGPPYFSIDGTKGGAVGIGTSTPTTVLTISNGINALGTLLINTWTNVTNAFTVKNAAGTTVFNIDTTATNPGLGVGATTTPWGTLSVTGDGTDPLFAVATTSNQGLPNFEIDVNGHEVTSGIKPTCTTNCTMLAGNDNAFRINTAAAVSSETVTFNKSWGVNAPICQATEGGNTASPIVIAASTTPTAVVLTNGSLSSKDIDVVCLGIQ